MNFLKTADILDKLDIQSTNSGAFLGHQDWSNSTKVQIDSINPTDQQVIASVYCHSEYITVIFIISAVYLLFFKKK